MKEIISISGARGVGKSTLVHYLGIELGWPVIHISEELVAFSKLNTGKGLFELDIPDRDIIREQYGNVLTQRLSIVNSSSLVDLHFSDYREGRDKIIQPDTFLQIMTGLKVLVAHPHKIRDRRLLRAGKNPILDIDLIRTDQNTEIKAARIISERFKLPLQYVLANGSVEAVRSQLVMVG